MSTWDSRKPDMARILICGTLAWDLIGHFDTPLGPETRNVKLDRVDEGFGGCAMNIAYNLRQLGAEAVPLVYAGDDYEPLYGAHVRNQGISEAGIVREPGARCARGIVLTGSDGGQFTAFHPGPTGTGRVAADLARLIASQRFDAAILAPDLPAKTRACADALADITWRIWCPGQYAEQTTAADLRAMLAAVDLVVANRHEWRTLRARLCTDDLPARPPRLVITQGAGPVRVLPERLRIPVPAVPVTERIDPTGCGDAFVAALTVGLVDGRPLTDSIRAGIVLAGHCLRQRGAQAH
jgi:adenosine kinase